MGLIFRFCVGGVVVGIWLVICVGFGGLGWCLVVGVV